MRIDDELIDDSMRNEPAWHPPAGFAERTAARGVEVLRGEAASAPRLWSWVNIAASVPLAVVTALAVYFSGELFVAIAPTITVASKSLLPAAWLWVAGSYAVAAWFALRTHAFD